MKDIFCKTCKKKFHINHWSSWIKTRHGTFCCKKCKRRFYFYNNDEFDIMVNYFDPEFYKD